MKEQKFYFCKECGAVAVTLTGEKSIPGMKELIPSMAEGAAEKHLPVVKASEGKLRVEVGSVFHPMTGEHHIAWVYLVTDEGMQCKHLRPDSEPVVTFALLEEEKPEYVYAYCNLHGLWKIDVR